MSVAVWENPFLKNTNLPVNSGGSGDSARLYQHQAHLDDVLHAKGTELHERTDKVYQNPETGRYFKVRLFRVASDQSIVRLGDVFARIQVSQCDADGWALPHDLLGWTLAPAETVSFPGDSNAPDQGAIAAKIEQQRLIMCAKAELRVRNEAAAALLPVRAPVRESAEKF